MRSRVESYEGTACAANRTQTLRVLACVLLLAVAAPALADVCQGNKVPKAERRRGCGRDQVHG